MIINFTVNNYKGIEKSANIYAKASNKIKRTPNHYSNLSDKLKILKTICIIGCNGSGKTSILNAMETVQDFISFPFRKSIKDNDEFVNYIKSMNEEELKNYLVKLNTLDLGEQNINKRQEKTEIELEIYVPKREENIEGFYTYTLEYDRNYKKNGVLLEKLTYRPRYEKKNIINLSKKENIIESQIGTIILYENNHLKTKDIKYMNYYKSFADEVLNHISCCFDGATVNIHDMLNNYKKEFIELCNIADDKITNVTIDENSDSRDLLFWNNNNNYIYFSQLSEGTKKIIILGSIIINALKSNSVILIDELEQSLHPTLVAFLINLVNSKAKNNFTQLIFTTHSPFLAFTLENDQLYFINNHNNEYFFSNISNAIKNKIITKDQSRQKAWIDDLLIKNPDRKKIDLFIKNKLD